MMFKSLFSAILILFLMTSCCYADEVLTGFEDKDIPILNNELENIKTDVDDLVDRSITTDSPVQGGVPQYDGTNWVDIGAGTDGQVLTSQGASANSQWETLPSNKDYQIKAWVSFDGTGVIAVNDSYNLDSGTPLVDNGTGDYTINFDTDFADTNYAVVGTCGGSGATDRNYHVAIHTKAVGSVRIQLITFNGVTYATGDLPEVSLIMSGDQ